MKRIPDEVERPMLRACHKMSVEDLMREEAVIGENVLTTDERSNYILNLVFESGNLMFWAKRLQADETLSALGRAVLERDFRTARHLLEEDPDRLNEEERFDSFAITPLMIAACNCDKEMLDILLDYPFEPNRVYETKRAHFTLLDLLVVCAVYTPENEVGDRKSLIDWAVARFGERCARCYTVYRSMMDGTFDELYDNERKILGKQR